MTNVILSQRSFTPSGPLHPLTGRHTEHEDGHYRRMLVTSSSILQFSAWKTKWDETRAHCRDKDKLLTLSKLIHRLTYSLKITVISSLRPFRRPLHFWMLYCCGGREKGEQEHTGAEEALMSCGEADTVTAGNREETPAAEMFDTTDMPVLLPPSGQLQPSPRDSVCQMQHLRVEFNRDCLSPESPQRRLGQRAPKLGQIGRSKRGQ